MSLTRADARVLGGRVKPGHGEFYGAAGVAGTAAVGRAVKPNFCARYTYASALISAACLWLAEAACPPSVFSQNRTSWPCASMRAAILRACTGVTRSSLVAVTKKIGGYFPSRRTFWYGE